jgi:hypothetical protein
MEGDRSFTGSPGLSKKVTWKEPIEQAVGLICVYGDNIRMEVSSFYTDK